MKTTQFKTLVAVIALCLLLTSCTQPPVETPPPETQATTAPTTEPTEEPTTTPTTEPTTTPTTQPSTEPAIQSTEPSSSTEPSTEPVDENALTQEEIRIIKELFTQKSNKDYKIPSPVNYFNRVMSFEFESTEQIDVRRVFYDQDIDENWELTEAEIEFLSKQEQIMINLDIVRVSSGKVDRILQECFGCSLEEIGDSESWVYFPDTDCYYHSKGDNGIAQFKITGGKWIADDLLEIQYVRSGFINLTMTLRKTDSNYYVVSNVITSFAASS